MIISKPLPSSSHRTTLLSLSNLQRQHYHYTGALEAAASSTPALRTHSPLRLSAWEQGLASYLDKAFAEFLLRGIREGFRVGAADSFRKKTGLQSAYEHKGVEQDYLRREEMLGCIQQISPEESNSISRLQISHSA